MNLTPWRNKRQEEPTHELSNWSDVRSEMERMFETFLREPFARLGRGFESLTPFGPALDIAESDKEVTVRIELPGVDPQDLDIQVSAGQLIVAGEKQDREEHRDEDFYHSERRFGSFRRAVQLPAGIDADRVTADFDKGVLTVRVPKAPGVKPKKVEVRAPEPGPG